MLNELRRLIFEVLLEQLDEFELEEAKQPKLGTGKRFEKLEKSLKASGAEKPGALAAWIGRKKYGKKRFAKLSAQGKK